MASEAKCPFTHTSGDVRSNRDWSLDRFDLA